MAMHSIHVTALDNFGSNLSPCSGVDFGFFMNYPDIKVWNSGGRFMHAMVQKKITIKREQEAFLAACREFGFADQSSLIRAALDDFIKETKRKQRRALITQKAGELAALYGC
jgi:hypothetical protein